MEYDVWLVHMVTQKSSHFILYSATYIQHIALLLQRVRTM